MAEVEGLADSIRPVLSAPDAITALDEFAAHLGRLRQRVRPIAAAIQRQRRSDPDFAAHREVIAHDQRRICRHLVEALHRESLLAQSWTVADATDMLWALMSHDLMDNLMINCGWSISKYVDHLSDLLRAVFVIEAAWDHR
ncbi:carboxypeptidase M32 [Nonomuraea basaltis]|uniref:carboxypeptidase M32 n=1 Tax=Nonomuraea basaltis TaxID=2495887 RepID=UPI00110C3EDA|nr:carboxypeptidase M32 [Nonomuraea basaltis]TMR88020.1 carboxypeptidase M32 [Nonomuraea basaltis]